jgi:death on curing protein
VGEGDADRAGEDNQEPPGGAGSKNHGFIDGNKRTTVILTHLLITASGYELCPLTEQEAMDPALEQLVLDTVDDVLDFDGIAAWFKARLRRVAD